MSRLTNIFKALKNIKVANNTNDQALALSSEKELTQQVEQLENDKQYYEEKYREQQKFSMYNLCRDLDSQIRADFIEILESDYPTDRLNEMTDSAVPTYNWELTQYLANDFGLATVDDEGLIEGVTDIFRIIAISIYEGLDEQAHETMGELKEEKQSFYEYKKDQLTNWIEALEEAQAADNDLDTPKEGYWEKTQKLIDNAIEKQQRFEELYDALDEF